MTLETTQAIIGRFTSIVDDLEFAPILESILDGTYNRWPGGK
jgi:hypothetical protein